MTYNLVNLPLDTDDAAQRIMIETALAWVETNTSIEIDPEAELPATVKLFVLKFAELYGQTYGVASESLGGMSQSFSLSAGGAGALLADLARELFGDAYKGRNRFVAAVNRWR